MELSGPFPEEQEEILKGDPIKSCLVKVLQGRIVYNGKVVPVKTSFSPGSSLNCITMHNKGGFGETSRQVSAELSPLPEDHNYFADPDELYNQVQRVRTSSKAVLSLHIWSNSYEGRDIIAYKVRDTLELALNRHFLFCTHRTPDGDCDYIGEECPGGQWGGRHGVMGLCPALDFPEPEIREFIIPESYFEKYGIDIDLVTIGEIKNIDEPEVTPELYRNIMDINVQLTREIDTPVNPLVEFEIESSEIETHEGTDIVERPPLL